jgi:hypothetical protein
MSVPAVASIGTMQLSATIQNFSRHNSISFQIEFVHPLVGDLKSRGQLARSLLNSAGAGFSTGKTSRKIR